MKDKETRWNEQHAEFMLDKYFTPRIARDVLELEEKIKDVEFSSIYLFGESHNGKTLMAAKSLWKQMKKDYIEGKQATYRFQNVNEFNLKLKATFGGVGNESTLIKELQEVDYLIFDDLGTDKVSEWSLQVLYAIINYRYEHLKPMFITSNYALEVIRDNLQDVRIPNRIAAGGKILELQNEPFI